MAPEPKASSRLVELIAALSLATDLGMGQPLEQALKTCLLAVRAGKAIGLSEKTLAETYYLALLRFVGCTADAHEAAAAVGGDEIKQRSDIATVLMGEKPEFMKFMLRRYAADQPPISRLRLLAGAFAEGTKGPKRMIAEHCEVAEMLSVRLGIGKEVGSYVGCVFERWDGKGMPGELAGEAIPSPARVVAVARDVEIFHRLGGWALVASTLRLRRAKAYDPATADAFLAEGERWLAEDAVQPSWDLVVASEPGPPMIVEEGST